MKKIILLVAIALTAIGCPLWVARQIEHNHCSPPALCFPEDGLCCSFCGGRCS